MVDNDAVISANEQTRKHKARVSFYLHKVVRLLLDRADVHDDSKMEDPEVAIFAEYTPKLAGLTYGSDEYNAALKEMQVALAHHYAKNRHHPEHFPDGIKGMTFIDSIEALCDWKAASERHDDGNIRKSIEHNTERFDIPPTLAAIFHNTVKEVFEV